MYPYDLSLLIAQMRQRELLQIVKSESLVRAGLKNQPNNHSSRFRTIDWIHGRLPENWSRQRKTCGQDRASISSVFR
jgi:hypothetical protein